MSFFFPPLFADTVAPAQHEEQFVWRRVTEPVHLWGKDVDGSIYWGVVGLVLVLGLAYVIWMYVRDSRSVGWGWASFLGVLRCGVYALLAWIFMLPAIETYEKTETYARVLVLFDVSGSMQTKDLAAPGDRLARPVSADAVLSRQDNVISLLTNKQIAFLKRLRDRNPVVLYRFGQQLDPGARAFEAAKDWGKGQWQSWLRPSENVAIPDGLSPEEKADFEQLDAQGRVRFIAAKKTLYAGLVTGTNLYESVLAALNRESNSRLQGIILVSDGRNTEFSQQKLDEVKRLAKRREVPIFTVGVGVERLPVEIMDPVVQAPTQVWPEDKFPIRVDVDAKNMPGHDIPVRLAIYKPNADPKKDKPAYEIEQKGTFSKDTTQPHAQVEFIIDPAQMPPELLKADSANGKPELADGTYKVMARILRDPLETDDKAVHASDPASINVQRRPLRVLLFAQGPTRDYQFLRTLLAREHEKGRAELSIRLQLASQDVVQDVEANRLLKRFPGTFHDVKDGGEDPYDNLAQYDVIIAFDPDWTELSAEQAQLLERWVSSHFGGLVVVAGPINTFQLTNPANFPALKPVADLFPVVLDDSRVHMGLDDRSSSEPFRLNFPGVNREMDFLKLNEDDPDPLAGWDEFFTDKKRSEGGDTAPLLRGFYSYYPVRDKKPAATVVATYTDPRARLSNGQEQPWMAYMPYGNGKVFYISSGEIWRLRQYHEAYHERFWTKLAHFLGSGNIGRLTTQGDIYMAPTFKAGGYVSYSAHLFGRDMRPLDGRGEAPRPDLSVLPPGVIKPKLEPMRYKQGSEGWFEGRFIAPAEGRYELSLLVPGTSVTLTKAFVVKEANPEKDNTMPDFAALKDLASDAAPVLRRVKDLDRKALHDALLQSNRPESPGEPTQELKLYFGRDNAAAIPNGMIADPRPLRTRGQDRDLWDNGWTLDDAKPRPHVLSWAMVAIIGLLSVEWLTRKLLKLA